MTSYSVLPAPSRQTIIASWPTARADRSAKVTTLVDPDEAEGLADALTRLSENAWDAAFWLASSPGIEDGIGRLIEALRSNEDKIESLTIACGTRHEDTWSFLDQEEVLRDELPILLSRLTRPQRLSVADEIEADERERRETMTFLAHGEEPSYDGRGGQAGLVTRTMLNGQRGPLPEGGAGWLVEHYHSNLLPEDLWAARSQLLRIEQLVASCLASGGRGRCEWDPLEAHCVIPTGKNSWDADVYYAHPQSPQRGRVGPFSPRLPMIVRRGSEELGQIDANDDEAFVRLLGSWVGAIPAWWHD